MSSSLPAGIRLVTQKDFCILNTEPGSHYPMNFGGGTEVVTTGRDGICILPDGSLVPGIEVDYSPIFYPPEVTIPLSIVRIIGKP